MINEPYKLYKNVKEGYISYDNVFSNQIKEKIKIFNFNIKINIFETELICKYDTEKTFAYTDKNQKYDYIIIKKDKSTGMYGALCIVKNDNQYVPMSSLYFEDYESLKTQLKDVLKNQEITLISGHKPYNNYSEIPKSYKLPEDVKAMKLSVLQEYKKDFGCIIDTTDDFKFLLNYSLGQKNQRFSNTNLIGVMIDAIKQGNLLDLEIFLNTSLFELAKSINDYLVNNSNAFDQEVGESYSKIYEERKCLLDKLTVLEERFESLSQIHEETIRRNQELELKNTQYEETNNAILKLLKPSE